MSGGWGRTDHLAGQRAESSRHSRTSDPGDCRHPLPDVSASGADRRCRHWLEGGGGEDGPRRPPQPLAFCHRCGYENCPCWGICSSELPLPRENVESRPGSWALFCPKYEAFSSPGGPDLGKWGDHVAGARQGAKLIPWASGQLAVAGSSGLRRKVPPSAGLLVCAMHGRARPEGEKQAGWRWWCTFRSTATSLGPLGSSIRALGKCRNWDVLLSGGGVQQASEVRGPWAGSGPQFPH